MFLAGPNSLTNTKLKEYYRNILSQHQIGNRQMNTTTIEESKIDYDAVNHKKGRESTIDKID